MAASPFSDTILARFCRNMSLSIGAGVALRKSLAREAEHAQGSFRKAMLAVGESVQQGDSLTEAMNDSPVPFPSLMKNLVKAGEDTGKLTAVMKQLSEHYDHQVLLARQMRSALFGPIARLLFAICVVAFIIWVAPFDMIGLGLVGTKGLVIYAKRVGVGMAGVALIAWLLRSGRLWIAPVQIGLSKIPFIGSCLQTFGVSRFLWTLELGVECGQNLKQALTTAFAATQNAFFSRHEDDVWQSIRGGSLISEALKQTQAFPHLAIDSIAVGEESGKVSEQLRRLAEIYRDQAIRAAGRLVEVLGWIVWALVALLIIMLVVRVIGSYAGMIQDLAR